MGSAIFFFSSQNGEASSSMSSSVTEEVLELIPAYRLFPDEKKSMVVSSAEGLIRSFAHFGLFFCLGISTILVMKCYPSVTQPYLFSMVLCGVYAVFDEMHQEFFSTGRAFQMVDLLKDWAGSAVGMAFVALLYWVFHRINHNRMTSTDEGGLH